MKKSTLFIGFFCILSCMLLNSCKKFIEVGPPPTSINAENVYQDDQTAAAVLTGLYTTLVNNHPATGTLPSLSLRAETSADNITLHVLTNATYANYFNNELSPTITADNTYWRTIYTQVYTCNAAIEGLENADKLTPSVRQQLLGEALFMRAFFYFYLANLYGDVPLVLTTNYKETALMPRTPLAQVYKQIISDLSNAKALLNDNYLDSKITNLTVERVRPNKFAAIALLARVYLYIGKDAEAEKEASLVIGSPAYEILPLATAFLANGKETIWALQPVFGGNRNTDEGLFYILTGAPSANFPLYVSRNLEQSFEAGDQRKTNWMSSVTASGVTYYYPFKYKIRVAPGQPITEYSIVMRIAEQYLIRAEARAKQNKLALAIEDLDIIRKRAGLSLVNNINPTISQSALLTQILKERRSELFAEWGHRWFDLKRLGLADQILGPLKGATWQPTDVFYPIPASEILANGNLVQNQGYSN